MQRLLSSWVLGLIATSFAGAAEPPGVVIDHIPASTGTYIGSPSIAILPHGDYVASHDHFGPKTTEHQGALTAVFRSADRGRSWSKVSQIQGQFWSSLFAHRDALYILGTDRHHGNAILRRSTDGGVTWTSPTDSKTGLLRDNGQYHCAPMPVVEHDGRLWRGMERRDPPVGWGITYCAGMLSAPVGADLLDAANWTFSNFLPGDRKWLGGTFGGWLEGNAVVTRDGQMVDMLRVESGYPEKAAIVRVSGDGRTLSFDPQTGFVDFPGGAKKFAIRHDAKSNLYWSLVTLVPEQYQGAGRPGRVRNTLALTSSPDLSQWTVRGVLLQHPDPVAHGFQYVDWLFDGDDMIAACRTAYDDEQGGAHNAHDANYLTFHRIANFRALAEAPAAASTYRRFQVHEVDGRVVAAKPLPDATPPRWAKNVSQQPKDWSGGPDPKQAYFQGPIPFVLPPEDAGEPFRKHNHQPSITWLNNGDLLAIWYSTGAETSTELTVLASRLRAGQNAWDPSSEFYKVPNRNMHGSSIFHDGKGTVYHFNGMGPDGGTGWARLALLLRTSADNGVTWTPPQPIGPLITGRHQVISGTLMTSRGVLIQCCDAVPGGNGGTALHLSADGGKTWSDPGEGKPAPRFTPDGTGEGTVAGIHAGVVELKEGRLMALGRGDTIDGHMPMSVSADLGKTWTYKASPFPLIGGGQRLVLKRLREGPILLVSFTSGNRSTPEAGGMTFTGKDGREFAGHGMFASLSFDEGATWPVRKLLTPGQGEFDGGAHTGRFTATATRAEHAGYLAATQTPDGVVHLISSRLHYRFNLAWLQAPAAGP